jgi:hypothetical protein
VLETRRIDSIASGNEGSVTGSKQTVTYGSDGHWEYCLQSSQRNNFRMSRHLQLRADDLAECLLVSVLEMRRSWNVEKRLEAYRDFGRIVERIEVLRRDAEELHANEDLLESLDRKVASIMRSSPYRVAEWFHLRYDVHWYVDPASIGPSRQVTRC